MRKLVLALRKRIVSVGALPYPSFPCFFGKRQGKPPKNKDLFTLTEALKSLERKGTTLKKNKEVLARRKKQGNPPQKNKESKDRVASGVVKDRSESAFTGNPGMP